MIILIEGTDLSGKSTLAKELQAKFGLEIIHGSSFEIASKGIQYMYEFMMGLLDLDNVIIDRFYFSNLIYATVYDKNMLEEWQVMNLRKKLREKEHIIIHLWCEIETLLERASIRGEEYINLKDLGRLALMYDELMISESTFGGLNVWKEYSKGDHSNLFKEIGMMING